jgi:hypothetical protein
MGEGMRCKITYQGISGLIRIESGSLPALPALFSLSLVALRGVLSVGTHAVLCTRAAVADSGHDVLDCTDS